MASQRVETANQSKQLLSPMSIQIRVQRKKASLNVLSDYTGEGWVIDSPIAGPQPRKVVRKVNSLETNDQK